jgi:hypothetical protein
MNRAPILILLCFIAFFSKAQTPQSTAPAAQPYGKIDSADLIMKECAFEKDANAMILFDKGDAYYDPNWDLAMSRHTRIKIFNDNGKDNANIRIEFYSGNHVEYITGMQAQTINMVDGKPEIIKLDKKLIYTEKIDNLRSAIVFSMPNVKAGSVIEYSYVWRSNSLINFPEWYFQDKIPTRYSEFTTTIPDELYFSVKANINLPLVKNAPSNKARGGFDAHIRAMQNIPSLPDEPYMSSYKDNLQSISYQLTSVKPNGGFVRSFSDTWAKVGGHLADDTDFGLQLKRKLTGEDVIITKAKALKTDDQKIEFVFNEVKNAMKWNGVDRWYTNDGTSQAWDKKSGNSAEVNLILFHLLKQAGVKAYPMVVSTRSHGKVMHYYTNLNQFNRAVVYIPIDTVKNYVLDATSKYNIYNEIPSTLLNNEGLYIDKDKDQYDMVFLTHEAPVRQVVVLNAEIKADGKMEGTAQINSFSYNRIKSVESYKTDGEKKYIDYLRDNNNSLKVTSLKFDNMDVDTLPLTQNIGFNLDLTGSDDNYIYFTPNLFTSLRTNPFLSDNRSTNIEFGYRSNYVINSTYKIPANYKVDGLPKSVSMSMPDGSIMFKRLAATDNGTLVVRYIIDYKKNIYFKEDYPEIHEFFKKMYEMLNEQIVLKKS